MRILVVNPGSSSLKLSVLGDSGDPILQEDLATDPAEAGATPLDGFLDRAGELDAVGVRIVHGGARLRRPTLVDDATLRLLDEACSLAPLHNPAAIAAIRRLRRLRPTLPIVACFDTGFHATMPDAAAVYPIPAEWTEHLLLRRLGFHGLSHAYASRRCAVMLDRPLNRLRLVTCHLGAGASLAAVQGGRSVDTTMGFTPMEGVMMATRSGSVDPGMILHIIRARGLSADQVEETLDRRSGVLGVSEISADMREVIGAADAGNPRAVLALAIYAHRLRAGISAMAAAMDGLDGVVFTGGVGEGSPRIRDDACSGLSFLGVQLDSARNAAVVGQDGIIHDPRAAVAAVVVHAREDLEIAAEVRALLQG
ncbi:MAG: acetate/propionate family kinase [Chloroflexi bacterium]|nr:MAG: acetate/propionate family kinase [Chloroflexota bacterium]